MTISPPPPNLLQGAIPEGPALITAYQQAQSYILTLEQENATLKQENTRVKQENITLRQEHAAAQQELRWIANLLAVPASILSPSHKATLYAAAKALQCATPDDQGLVHIESWNLCKTVGQSKDTFLDNLTYLSETAGILRKKTQRVVTEDGTYTTNLSIGATDLIAHPERYHVEKPRNHGGERLRCPHCYSDRLQKKVIITCMGCGAVLEEQASQIKKTTEPPPKTQASSKKSKLPTRKRPLFHLRHKAT